MTGTDAIALGLIAVCVALGFALQRADMGQDRPPWNGADAIALALIAALVALGFALEHFIGVVLWPH